MNSIEITLFGGTGLIGGYLKDLIIDDPFFNKINFVTRRVYKSNQKKYAAIGYGGYNSDSKSDDHYKKLKTILKNNNIKYSGNPIYLGYDPPYKFWGRKNEILLELE